MVNGEKVTGYVIIKGLPEQVEQNVNQRLQEGWYINGEPMLYTSPTSNKQLVLQNMVTYGNK